jgi:hypothetical protein
MEAIKNYLKVMFGTKTGRTAFAAIVGVVLAYFNQTITPNEAVLAIFAAIQTINIRDAVKKSGPEAVTKQPSTGGGGTGE